MRKPITTARMIHPQKAVTVYTEAFTLWLPTFANMSVIVLVAIDVPYIIFVYFTDPRLEIGEVYRHFGRLKIANAKATNIPRKKAKK